MGMAHRDTSDRLVSNKGLEDQFTFRTGERPLERSIGNWFDVEKQGYNSEPGSTLQTRANLYELC